jgi:hypothetical protein
MNGPRRVDVHQPGKAMVTHSAPGELTAPGVLARAVPIEALYDEAAAREAVLANLLARFGYDSMESVRVEAPAEGRAEGLADGRAAGELAGARNALLTVMRSLNLPLAAELEDRILRERSPTMLRRRLTRAVRADNSEEIFLED